MIPKKFPIKNTEFYVDSKICLNVQKKFHKKYIGIKERKERSVNPKNSKLA
jgi:hypothetical protein